MAGRSSLAVSSSLALKGVLEKSAPAFEQSLGVRLDMRFDATQAILAEFEAGLRADLLVLTAEAMEALRASGKVAQVRALGSSGVGIAVRAGAPKPDISSVDALKRALVSARSVAHSKVGASGIYFAELLQRFDIRLKKRVVVEKGPVGLVVAAGEAELGVQQLCELAPVPGIEIVGPLPEPVQRLTHFAAGIPANAANPKGASALLALLRTDAVRADMVRGGIVPSSLAEA
ncbi:MAG TPA: substrate-binding domain-containing protein [Burkholderiales bacterium]|jgi:molybdate transport system substrate-binding protein